MIKNMENKVILLSLISLIILVSYISAQGFIATGTASCGRIAEACGEAGCCEGLKCGTDGRCERIPGAEVCNDKIDNDGNGLVDCLDPKCKSTTSCGGYEDTNVVNNIDNQNSGLGAALIIGISIIIGFIILAIILVKVLKKKK